MSHLNAIRDDSAYAEILENWDANFYAKFTDVLRQAPAGSSILDVGCGVGQVVGQLMVAGYEVHGVDVAEPNIQKAQKISPRCQLYDGKRLPYPDRNFSAVGALNVLEHVEDPEAFLAELVRVTEVGGRIVVSSPNFFRGLGFRDYHPRMRGIGNKWRNARRLLQKRHQMRHHAGRVRFDRMTPIVKEQFTPDDDAIVATNALEMEFFLERYGCEIITSVCTDHYVAMPVELVLNVTPLRYLLFNAFVVARRKI